MKALLLIVLAVLLPVIANGQARTSERIVSVPFSQLNTGNPPDGSERYVINGLEGTTPCTAGGNGAVAFKINGQWECPKLTPGLGTGDIVGPSSSAVGELMLFSSTSGKNAGRSNTLNGILFATNGVASTLASTGSGSVVRDTSPTVNAPTLITPTISSLVNAQHTHETGPGGGQLNASNVFNAGTIPPARIISGSIVNSRCVRVGNTGQVEVAAFDCGAGGGGTPGGVSGNLTFNQSGAFGGLANSSYNSSTGQLTLTQFANGNDTLNLQRFTDSGPTGNLLRARNAANTTDLFRLAVDGVIVLSNTVISTNVDAPATPAAGTTVLWTDSTDKNLRAQDDAGNVSVTVRAISCSGTDKLSAISSAGVPTCTADQGGTGTGVITLNGLSASDQTFAKVDDTNVTLGIGSSTSVHTFTIGWAGTLAKGRQNAATVYTDQANTWSTGAQDFSAATSLKVPSAAGASPTVSGLVAFDLTSFTLEYGENGTNRSVANTAGSQTLSNKTLDNSNVANLRDTQLTLQDNVDSTKTVNFELGGITSGTNRVVTVANAASVTVVPTTATTNQFVTHIDSNGVVQKAQPSFSNISGTVLVTQGSTGQSAVAQGDLLYGDATNSWARLPKDTNATRVLTNTGASNNPSWAQLSLTTGVTGILPSANGGSNNGFFAVSGPAGTTKTFAFPNASATVLTDNTAVTIAQGGTGQTSQTAAFNALDPLTTKGDILTHNGTDSIRLAVGTNGQALVADSTVAAGIKWASITATAGGSTTQLQYNNAGALAGISGATTDGTTTTFAGSNIVIGNTNSPATPTAGRLYVNTTEKKLYMGIVDGTICSPAAECYGEVFISGLSQVNLASDNVTGTLPSSRTEHTVNAQTGTSYTVVDGDRGKLIAQSNAGATAYTLPNAAGAGFDSGWYVDIQNRGAGTVTITPTTSTIDGGASLAIAQNQGVRIFSDGTNYFTQRGIGGSGGSGTVTVVGSGSLTSTALVTGGGTTTVQTPSVTATLDSSGNMSLPGSLTLSGSGAGYFQFAPGTAPTVVASQYIYAAPATAPGGGLLYLLPSDTPVNGEQLTANISGTTVTLSWDAAGSGGSGDAITVNGSAATDANFLNTTASGTVPSVTWSLNTASTPDDISISAIGAASTTEAGIITTGTQSLAGTKILGHTAALGRLGQTFEVTTGANSGGVALNTFSATALEAPVLDFNRSKSATKGTQTVVAADDTLGYVTFRGSDGTAFQNAASIQAAVDGTPGASDMPGRLSFWTTLDGSATPTERWRITNAGHLLAVADNTYDIGGTGPNKPRNIYVGTAVLTPLITWATSVQDSSGAGSPEAVVTAGIGSVYRRTDGGAATTLYVKESGTGNTGWVAVGGGGGSGTINSGVTNVIPKYTAATTLDDSLLSDDGTNLVYGGTGQGSIGLKDSDASNYQTLQFGSNITADRIFTITTGDAARTLSMSGNITTAADFITSGANSLTLTTTGATNVTVPTTGTLATLAGAETFTNKTIDPEATGNNIGAISPIDFPAAGCSNTTAVSFWDLPTSTPAVAACVSGTNTQKAYLDFADTTGGFSAQTGFRLPADFTGTVDAKITWLTTATTGNVKWSLSTICVATDATETDDPAFNTASTVTTAAAGVASRLQTSAITSVTITGCAAGEWMHVKIFRDGNDAADTIAATARLVGVQLILRRAQ